MSDHWSDCAVNNEPAYPAGSCDCGGFGRDNGMVERVRSAMVAIHCLDDPSEEDARHVLAAMREPTEAMCIAGESRPATNAYGAWLAMIDEALKEPVDAE